MKGKFNAIPAFTATFENLIAVANPNISPPLSLSEVTVGAPIAHVGDRNTRIALTFPEQSRFTGSVDFFYDRIDLSELVSISKLEAVIPHLVPAGAELTAGEVVAAIEARYGVTFEPGALAVSPLAVLNIARFSHELTITASGTSKIWKGSLTVKVEKPLREHIANKMFDGPLTFSHGEKPISYTNDFEELGTYPAYTVQTVATVNAINTAIRAANEISIWDGQVFQELLEFDPETNVETGILVERHANERKVYMINVLETNVFGELTNFSIRCKDNHEYRGSLIRIGWETLPMGLLAERLSEKTIYRESGIMLDSHDIIPEINAIYGFNLVPEEVKLTAAIPVPGQPNKYTVKIQAENSLNYHGHFTVILDLTGDPYRFINANTLTGFDIGLFSNN